MANGFFDFLEAINTGKEIVLDGDDSFKEYVPFQVNNGLSQHLDTVLIANEMNKLPNLSKEMQFKFLANAVSKKKRFGKWAKPEEEANKEDIETVSTYYQVNRARAREYLKILKPEQLEVMRTKNNPGGCDLPKRGKK